MNDIKIPSLFLSALLTATLLTGCGGSGSEHRPLPTPTPTPVPAPAPAPAPAPEPAPLDFQALLDTQVSDAVPGMVLLVGINGDTESFVAGISNKETLTPMQRDAVMPAGSAGKSMIAVLALQLQEEGLLNLDDTLDTWLEADILDQIVNSRQMTLRQLLNHTSGVYDFLENPQFASDILQDPTLKRLDTEVLSYAYGQPAYFQPGVIHRYSNTGYLLAGLILDRVLGEHHSKALRERILLPLGMDQSYYLAAESQGREFISGYRSLSDLGLSDDTSQHDLKPLVNQLGIASSPVASTVADFAMYQRALAEEDILLNEQSREELVGEQYVVNVNEPGLLQGSTVEYGLGVYRETTENTTLFHHGGDHYGWLTQNIIWPHEELQIVLMTNCGGDVCQAASTEVVQSILSHYQD